MVYTTAQLLGALLTVDGRAVEGGAIELPTNARLLLDVIVEGSAPGAVLDNLALLTPEVLADIDAAAALGATNNTATASFVTGAGATQTALDARYVSEGSAVADLAKQAGVDPTGVTECAAAIQTALNSAASLGHRLVSKGTYKIGSTVTIAANIDLSEATFSYTGAGTAVVVGDPTGPSWRKRVRLPKVTFPGKPTTGWTAGTIGVKVTNAYSYEIDVNHITRFEVGLLVYGESTNGTSYTTFHMGWLENNMVNLKLDASATGWANQNVFIGGRFNHNSAEGVQVAGTRHIQVASTTNIVNGNLWVGPSIESPNVVEYHVEMYGQYNTLLNARLENTGGTANRRIWSRGTAKGNRIVSGFNTGQVTQVLSDTARPFDIESDVQRLIRGGDGGVPTVLLENISSSSSPALTVMAAGAAAAAADPATAWTAQLTAQKFKGKRDTDTTSRLELDLVNGRFYFGGGVSAPTKYVGDFGTGMAVDGAHLHWGTDNTYDIGVASFRPRYLRVGTAVQTGSGATGSRPAAATAGTGAMWFDTTLGKPIWSTGAAWVDATGAVV